MKLRNSSGFLKDALKQTDFYLTYSNVVFIVHCQKLCVSARNCLHILFFLQNYIFIRSFRNGNFGTHFQSRYNSLSYNFHASYLFSSNCLINFDSLSVSFSLLFHHIAVLLRQRESVCPWYASIWINCVVVRQMCGSTFLFVSNAHKRSHWISCSFQKVYCVC